MAGYAANVRKIHIYQTLANLSLWMPIWMVFFQSVRDLSLAQVTLLSGIGWLATAVFEVPTGAVADSFGRRTSLALGTGVLAVAIALWGTMPSFWGILLATLVSSLGIALQSGADMAMLYDSMVAAGREEDYARMAGRSFALIQLAQALASVAGGWLAAWRFDSPILLTSGLLVVAFLVVLTMKEPPELGKERQPYLRTLSTATGFIRSRRDVRFLMAFTALLSAVVWMIPFTIFQPYLADHAVPVGWFGLLFMTLRLSAVFGSRYGPRLINDGSLPGWLAAVPIACTVGFAVLGLVDLWAVGFAAMLVIGFLNGCLRPHLSLVLNRRVTSQIRTTLLSLQSLLFTLLIAGLQPVLGLTVDAFGLSVAFLALAGVSLLPHLLRTGWRPAPGEPPAPPAPPPTTPTSTSPTSTSPTSTTPTSTTPTG